MLCRHTNFNLSSGSYHQEIDVKCVIERVVSNCRWYWYSERVPGLQTIKRFRKEQWGIRSLQELHTNGGKSNGQTSYLPRTNSWWMTSTNSLGSMTRIAIMKRITGTDRPILASCWWKLVDVTVLPSKTTYLINWMIKRQLVLTQSCKRRKERGTIFVNGYCLKKYDWWKCFRRRKGEGLVSMPISTEGPNKWQRAILRSATKILWMKSCYQDSTLASWILKNRLNSLKEDDET